MSKINTISQLKTFSIVTLGCKVNNYESNVIINDLLAIGLLRIDSFCDTDLIIINTCSVTNTADSKSRNYIRRARKSNPDAIILVCGCYSQVDSNNLKDDFGIDILLGNKYKNNIVEILNNYFKTSCQIVQVDNLLLEKEFEPTKSEVFKNRTRAFIKIQDGCNFMCSYCIIPFTRGRQRSKDFNQLIKEINVLVWNGYKEIVLTGVNTAGYQNENYHFFDLLKIISQMPGDFRVRISSVEPFQITDDIVRLICLNPQRFAQHWHICLQSGSDDVLVKMNRKYTTSQFESLVSYIYKLNPLTAITTDYICGFPTETNRDHQNSIAFVKKIGFSKLHVFPYSMRNYTPAAKLKQIHSFVKTRRTKEMLKLSDELTTIFLNRFLNQAVDVLFETYDNGINKGYSSQYFTVLVKSEQNLANKLLKVKIKKIFLNQAFGEII